MKLNHTTYGRPRDEGGTSDDAARVHVKDGAVIAALADGLGSSAEGHAAAQRAVDMMVDYYLTRPQAWTPRRALAEFVRQINRTFYRESQLRYGRSELLCTLSVAVLEDGRLYGVNVGDSPVLLGRTSGIATLSEAHAVDEKGLEHGLTRAIGLEAEVEPYAFETQIEDGDLIVLCSDGVSSVLNGEELETLLRARASARRLVARARELTAKQLERQDDATAIVLDLVRGDFHTRERRALEVVGPLESSLWIDDYRLARALDDRARVWLAKDRAARPWVLKFPPLEAAEDESLRDAFLREIWQSTRVDSPDFVTASVPATGSLRYYVMPYVDAPSLRRVLQAGPLRVEDTVLLGKFLVRACAFLLRHDHAHGDIKPDNILVLEGADTAPRFQLLDLGSSAEVFSVTSRAGTPSYLAPERFHRAPLSERTELYAIGVTLYEALTRSYPYGEVERFQTPRFDGTPKRPSLTNPAVPPWLEAIALRAIAADAGSRYQNYSEMAYELEHPDLVQAYHQKGASLLERNPLRFYQLLCLVLFFLNLFLVGRYGLGLGR